MTHFTSEEWADFARQCVSPADQSVMQAHLESGCSDCIRTLQFWLGVLDVAGGVERYCPPESGTRFVKSLYSLFSPGDEKLRIDVPQMVFPDLSQALPQGMRGEEVTRHHYLYERGDMLLDVHLDLPQSGEISMAGQVMDTKQPDTRFGGRPVSVRSGTTELASAVTNEFGEFHLDLRLMNDLMLVMTLADGTVLAIRLPDLFAKRTSPESKSQPATEDPNADKD